MKVALLSANLRRFERRVPRLPQTVPAPHTLLEHTFTDADEPPRVNLSPRLQSRICKILGFERVPGADVYVWMDAQFVPLAEQSAWWLVEQLGDADLVLFNHPSRHTIAEEAAHISAEIGHSQRLMVRYLGDPIDQLLAIIAREPTFRDQHLYACGLFAYRMSANVAAMLRAWWYYVSAYTNNDQLSLPFVAWRYGVTVKGLDGDVFHSGHFQWTRGRKHV